MSKIFYTSDLHLGHRKVASLRGYGEDTRAVEPHDATILAALFGMEPDDVVYVLGDLTAGGTRATRDALDVLTTIPGRKRLIFGNHDPGHPMNRDAHRWASAYAEVFEWAGPFARRKVAGQEFLLSHFPYARDRGEARFLQYRLRDEGSWLLHGHTHGEERLTPESREVHVGWDAWGRLVEEGEVLDLIASVDPAALGRSAP